ncbi:MAG: acyl CoA:acetate/3-ketoacid CoA transferase subunit beta [Proteobacteria bacterium]|nr:acyl CoA:acetate/3-ketoacid CoA transferase subunit beta [Pseudomonadota bacterium]
MSFHRQMTGKDEIILRRAAQEVQQGQTINLGIGLPTMLPIFLPATIDVMFHAENGCLGMGKPVDNGTPDYPVIDAGGRACHLVSGAACFDSVLSFTIVRGGRLDLVILGAFEVAINGDLANWTIPGKSTPGMGGGMEVAQKAKRVMVLSHHLDKNGRAKLAEKCSLPLTAPGCVDTLITEQAVFRRQNGRLTLVSLHPDTTLEIATSPFDFKVPVAQKLETWRA